MKYQITDKFLKKKIYQNLLKLNDKFYINLIIKPVIKFNNNVFNINKTILLNFNNTINIIYKDIKIENFYIKTLDLKLSMPFLIQNLYLKSYTKIEKFLVEILMNSQKFYLKIYLRVYDIQIHDFRALNKVINFNIENNNTNINSNIYKCRKNFNLEFWEKFLFNDKFDSEIWCNLELKKD